MIFFIITCIVLFLLAGIWRRFLPHRSIRGFSPEWIELFALIALVGAMWRFPIFRWVGLIAVAIGLLAIWVKNKRKPTPS